MKTPPGFFFTAPPGIPTGGLPMGVAWSLRSETVCNIRRINACYDSKTL